MHVLFRLLSLHYQSWKRSIATSVPVSSRIEMALVRMASARALDRPPQIEVAGPCFQSPQRPDRPAAPTLPLRVGNEDGQIQVQWTAVQTTPEVKYYTVGFRQVGSSQWMLIRCRCAEASGIWRQGCGGARDTVYRRWSGHGPSVRSIYQGLQRCRVE